MAANIVGNVKVLPHPLANCSSAPCPASSRAGGGVPGCNAAAYTGARSAFARCARGSSIGVAAVKAGLTVVNRPCRWGAGATCGTAQSSRATCQPSPLGQTPASRTASSSLANANGVVQSVPRKVQHASRNTHNASLSSLDFTRLYTLPA